MATLARCPACGRLHPGVSPRRRHIVAAWKADRARAVAPGAYLLLRPVAQSARRRSELPYVARERGGRVSLPAPYYQDEKSR